MTTGVETLAATIRTLVLSLSAVFISSAGAQTAAETDWVTASDLIDAQLELLPANCEGLYVQPAIKKFAPESGDSETIHATAHDALHVVDQSTTFTGDVELQQGTRQIYSSFLFLDAASNVATMQGSVSIREPGILLRGESATTNLLNGTGVIDSATFILHESRMRGSATRIHKEENNQLLIADGNFTRCDPDDNTWSVHGNSIRLIPEEGHGVARNVTLKVKNVPVGYFPYFRFPITDARLSGFLAPSFGHDNTGGTDISIPYYFNLAPQYDAIYSFRSLWKRGLIHNGEFRHLSKHTNNLLNASYLHDDDIYDDRTDFDLSSGGTFPEFEKQDRWLIHTTHSGAWTDNWRTSLDYSAVSDTDYLRDIGGDITSTAIQQGTNQIQDSYGNNTIPALNREASITHRNGKWAVVRRTLRSARLRRCHGFPLVVRDTGPG
jgi:LPS-assembly protein